MIAVNADFFYVHEAWVGRHLLPLIPLLGTVLLVYAIWRTQAGDGPQASVREAQAATKAFDPVHS
jgi:hypothetical protein